MNWAEDHAAGLHQAEIVGLIRAIEPHLEGHPRAIIIFALGRLMAAMLAPARKDTQDRMLEEMPRAIRAIMDEMIRLKNAQ
jgi:hypothetical protein